MNTSEKIALASVIIAVISLIAFVINAIDNSPSPVMSSISVTSSPAGASIYLDGSYKGTTPMTITDLEEGYYTITLERTDYQEWSQTIQVDAGKNSVSAVLISINGGGGEPTPALTPIMSSISVTSSPAGASIYLDGSYKGTTPMTITDIEEGYYTITLERTDYQEWSQTIQVDAGKTNSVPAVLISMPEQSIIVSVNTYPRTILAGESTEISVMALSGNVPVQGANVKISAGGGSFEDTGNVVITGITDDEGCFRTIWHTCEKSAYTGKMGYAFGVDVSKSGYESGYGEGTVFITI